MKNYPILESIDPNTQIISNSEVDSFLSCERKHFYHFLLNKEPNNYGRSLSIGIIGHDILAELYRAVQAGADKKTAYRMGMVHLSNIMESSDNLEPIAVVQVLISRYWAQDTLAESSEILAVEKDYYIPITKEFAYGMRLDLMVRPLMGRAIGQVKLLDHKFTYDFFTPNRLMLNPQMPKYVGAVRYNGTQVADATINQLRTRFHSGLIPKKTDEELFRRAPVPTPPERIKNSLKQQIIGSERIVERRRMPLELAEQEAIPILNNMICQNCPYQLPCQMQENGQDISGVMKSEYKDRTYGYSAAQLEQT